MNIHSSTATSMLTPITTPAVLATSSLLVQILQTLLTDLDRFLCLQSILAGTLVATLSQIVMFTSSSLVDNEL